MTDYEKIYDFQNLYKAHTVARRSKRNTREVIELGEINQVLSSYRAHLAYGHTYKLQKKILSDFILRRK